MRPRKSVVFLPGPFIFRERARQLFFCVPRVRVKRALTIWCSVLMAVVVAISNAWGQGQKVVKVGILTDAMVPGHDSTMGFRDGLRDLGYVEGKGVIFEIRAAQGDPNRVSKLNRELVGWALRLTQDTKLADSEAIQRSRARFVGFPNAMKPPFITRGDTISGGTFWHGSKMDEWANEWTKYYTGGTGNYMVSAMEDTGTLQALTFLDHAGLVDVKRVLVLRTVSNFDREAPGTSAAESLKGMVFGNYSAYMPALETAEVVGDRVVRDIVEHWSERDGKVPH